MSTFAFVAGVGISTKPVTLRRSSFTSSVSIFAQPHKFSPNTTVAHITGQSLRSRLVRNLTNKSYTPQQEIITKSEQGSTSTPKSTSNAKKKQNPTPFVSSFPVVPVPAHFVTGRRPLRSNLRLALAFCANVARRISTLRRKHPVTLKLARMGLSLSLAAVCMVVSRGALGPKLTALPVATISAPTLPNWVPPNVAAILKPFTEAFGVVFLSEFGDKSMFATALMAMKYSPFIVCIGALAALTVMTFIACFLGQLMQYLPATITHYSSIALFVFFGLQMIMQSRNLPDTPGGAGGERADAEEMVAGATMAQVQSPLSVLAKVSSLIFVAEWCDRSMLATMALAASSNTVAVIGGATFANIVCTGVAVCGAALVSSRISEKMVALVAGILFEVFAVFTYLEGPEG